MTENILFDVLLHKEWKYVDEFSQRGSFLATTGKTKLDVLKEWFSSLFTSTIIGLPRNLYKLKFGSNIPFKLAAGHNKKSDVTLLAIALNETIEIRSSRDSYSTAVSKCSLSSDPHPGWRYLTWSPDCSILMMAYSTGCIEVFDLLGIKLCSITNDVSALSNSELPGLADFSASVVSILFLDVRGNTNQKWNYKIVVANYKGFVNCYYINSVDGEHEKLFSLHISAASSATMPAPASILDMCQHELHPNLIFIASPPSSYDDIPESYRYGLSIWRLLSDYPHLKMVVTGLADEPEYRSRFSPMQWLKDKISRFNHFQIEDWIQKISLSPDAKHLISAHESGAVSLWEVPSLRLNQYWSLEDQPTENLVPDGKVKILKRFDFGEKDLLKLSDIHWWNNKSVVLNRLCGALTISSTAADMPLLNLLGDSPEFVDCPPSPCITIPKDGRFFFLDCSTRITARNRRAAVDRSQLNELEDLESEDEDEDLSILSSVSSAAKNVLYFLTDSERFQPPKKKPKIKVDTFRLKEFKVATPEELFTRRLASKEYEEALEIAKIYDLDTDIVYQTQWRDSPISAASVKNYLTKIRKSSWVIRECLDSVPQDLQAVVALIEYGLKLTDVESIFSSLIPSGSFSFEVNVEDDFSGDEEEYARRVGEKIRRRREELVGDLDVKELKPEHKDRILERSQLLKYLKRLQTYRKILEFKRSPYDSNFYNIFRQQSAFEATVHFAQESDVEAVSTMLSCNQSETLKHLLAIVSNFPETLSPRKYQKLLPRCCPQTNAVVCSTNEANNNEAAEDWCIRYFSHLIGPDDCSFEKQFYIDHEDLVQYMGPDLSKEHLSNWFKTRAREIEELSSIMDNSLSLLQIGIEHDVPDLEKLLDDFETFETICYYCIPYNSKDQLDFSRFDRMNNSEKIEFVMYGAAESPENFVKRVKEYLLPFLEKCTNSGCPEYYQLLSHYFKSSAKHNLTLCAKVFENSKVSSESPAEHRLIKDIDHLLQLAMDCIYACEESDQLDSAFDILECLPQNRHNYPSKNPTLYDEISKLEKHMAVAELLEQYNYILTVKDVKKLQDEGNTEQVKQIFIRLTRIGIKKIDPPFKEKEWQQLFADLQEIRQDCFENIVSLDDVYEIFVKALMVSGKRENFGLASSYMQLVSDSGVKRKKLLPYRRSINVLIEAAREYINSANSITDKVIDLAKECLLLINKEERKSNEAVREELDFIEALALLYSEFGIKLLPIQVRLIEQPRLSIITKVLQNEETAARKSPQLLKLAQQLRLCKGEDDFTREGKVLALIGNFLFDRNYFTDCWRLCETMMEKGYTPVWRLCKKLGYCDGFRNRDAKLKLLSFVAAYCEDYTGQEIESTLHEIRRLKCLPEEEINRENLVDKSLEVVSKTAHHLTSWVKR